jgi:phospholipid/cholesterol/gamma-HCH transport system substrate-binding protein
MTSQAAFRRHLATFVAFIALGAGFTLFWIALGGGLPSFGGNYQVRALLPTAGSLTPGARVTMAGYQVGKVTGIERDGAGALVSMEISDGRVTPLPRDSRVALRERTPVGENYVSISPGSARATLPSGSALPMTQADDYVDVDQLLSSLQGRTRGRARELIQGVGGAVQGQAPAINAFLGSGSDALSTGSHLVALLAHERAQVGRLVDNLGAVGAAVGQRGADIELFARRALTTFDALSARDEAVRRLLVQLPSTLTQVQDTTATLGTVSRVAAPVLYNLASAVTAVRPAVQLLAPAARQGRSVLHALGAASPALTSTLAEVRSLAGPATAALPAVQRTFCQLDPMIAYAKPYTADIISMVGGLGSAANDYDSVGHLIRITLMTNDNSFVGLPANVSQSLFTLLHSGLIGKVTGPLTFDPYPRPGQIGTEHASGDHGVLGPGDVPSTGYRFPHLLSDC